MGLLLVLSPADGLCFPQSRGVGWLASTPCSRSPRPPRDLPWPMVQSAEPRGCEWTRTHGGSQAVWEQGGAGLTPDLGPTPPVQPRPLASPGASDPGPDPARGCRCRGTRLPALVLPVGLARRAKGAGALGCWSPPGGAGGPGGSSAPPARRAWAPPRPQQAAPARLCLLLAGPGSGSRLRPPTAMSGASAWRSSSTTPSPSPAPGAAGARGFAFPLATFPCTPRPGLRCCLAQAAPAGSCPPAHGGAEHGAARGVGAQRSPSALAQLLFHPHTGYL